MLNTNRNNWSEEELTFLLKNLNAGKPALEISRNLSRTYEATRSKIKQLTAHKILKRHGAGPGTKYELSVKAKNAIITKANTEPLVKVKAHLVRPVERNQMVEKGELINPVTTYNGGFLVYSNKLYKEVD